MDHSRFSNNSRSGDATISFFGDSITSPAEMWSTEDCFGSSSTCLLSPATTSFSSTNSSTLSSTGSYDQMRRLSMVSRSTSDFSSGTQRSPMTPRQPSSWHAPMTAGTSRKLFFSPTHCFAEDLQAEQSEINYHFWVNNGLSVPLERPLISTNPTIPTHSAENKVWNSDNSSTLPADGPTDVSISSQAYFNNTANMLESTFGDGSQEWTASETWQRPQTVAPHATFQPLLLSSPAPKVEPSSPFQLDASDLTAKFPDSSPLQLPSSPCVPLFPVIPTQSCHQEHALPELSRHSDNARLQAKKQRRQQRRGTSPVTQALYSDMTRRSKGHRVTVVPHNQFECGYEWCVDKRGKRRSFRRQEHRKRHVDTIHERKESYTCWVSKCHKVFSRNDNLQTHLSDTHGKTSPNRRNRYVATLDQKSSFYDPEWKGELTEDGYPLLPAVKHMKCWVPDCRKPYYLEDKLRVHLLQQHGRKQPISDAGGKPSGSDVSYVASLDEHSDCFDPDWERRLVQDGASTDRDGNGGALHATAD